MPGEDWKSKGVAPGEPAKQGDLEEGDVKQVAHDKADALPVIGPGPAPAARD
jgi:hypothetical protein